MQNSEHFESVADVADFWARGQRLSQLTYNGPNRIGNGCACRRDDGLTEFGHSIVTAMNDVGMIIDASHTGERTTLDAIETSAKPVLITHSNCKALVPHPRCKSDAAIRAMARKGGVMGVTCVRTFLRRTANASLDDALDHIAHTARIGGVEHVGIGSDKDVAENPVRIYQLTDGMLRRRWSPEHIRLVLGGNFQRVIGEVLS
jgi:membrane dipeptidase